jgi:hypothetical protein
MDRHYQLPSTQVTQACRKDTLGHSPGREEIEKIRYAIKGSRPYGSEKWMWKAVAKFPLRNTLRNRGPENSF